MFRTMMFAATMTLLVGVPRVGISQVFQGEPKVSRAPIVERSYDRFRDYTTTKIVVGPVGSGAEEISLVLYYFSAGKMVRPITGSGRVDFTFFSRSEHWKFLKSQDMHFLTSNGRFSARRGAGDSEIHFGAGVSEMVSATIPFEDFRKVASSATVEIAVGTAEFALSAEQVGTLRRFALELSLDAAGLEALEKARDEERKREATAKAERDRIAAEADLKAREEWDAKVTQIYPVARKALIEAKNRGSGAPVSVRKGALKRETERAAAILCKTYGLSRAELDQVISRGRELETSTKEK